MNEVIPLQTTNDYHLKWQHCKWDVRLEGVFSCPWGNVTARFSRTESKLKKNYFPCLLNITCKCLVSRQEKQSAKRWLKDISNDQEHSFTHLPKCQRTQKSIIGYVFFWNKECYLPVDTLPEWVNKHTQNIHPEAKEAIVVTNNYIYLNCSYHPEAPSPWLGGKLCTGQKKLFITL